jgi:hypothetical protein
MVAIPTKFLLLGLARTCSCFLASYNVDLNSTLWVRKYLPHSRPLPWCSILPTLLWCYQASSSSCINRDDSSSKPEIESLNFQHHSFLL